MQVITDALLILHVVWAANKGGLWCYREWKLSCHLRVGKRTHRGSAVSPTRCAFMRDQMR